MIKSLKHGMHTGLKIKSNVKNLVTGIVLFSWFLSIIACSQEYISLQALTATSASISSHYTATHPSPSITIEPTSQNTLTPFPEITHTYNTQEIPTAFVTITPNSEYTQTLASNSVFKPPLIYTSQEGDSLKALAARFDVLPEEITSDESIPDQGFISPGQLLVIPDRLDGTGPADLLMPDSEIIFSPSTIDFDINKYVEEAGGYLSTYYEYRVDGWHSGAEIIEIISREESFNPRLLLSLLEYQSHWVFGQPGNIAETDYPIGWINLKYRGLYFQLKWTVQQLSMGYYGWRDASLKEIVFPDQGSLRLAPELNSGSVALQYLFSKLYNTRRWFGAFYDVDSFIVKHEQMFGDPWLRAQENAPFIPEHFTQPELELPFSPGHEWNFTGGPHPAWGPNSALAALDFAPLGISGCQESTEWVTASASGVVVRRGEGLVVVDLDGDGYEQTGWVMIYMHIDTSDTEINVGTFLKKDDQIGHPSCEGGTATGTHLHIARKYNGEWMLAGGPIPFVIGGWEAQAGAAVYDGTLSKDDQIIMANSYSSFETVIKRQISVSQ